MSLGFDCKECVSNLKMATEAQDRVKELTLSLEDSKTSLSVLREELHRSYAEYSEQAQRTIDSSLDAEKAKQIIDFLSEKFKITP